MIQAVANCRVPKVAIVIGGSYGAGNYAMCGRGLDPRFIFAWPNSRTAVMGPAQAGKVMRIVAEDKQRRGGLEPDPKNCWISWSRPRPRNWKTALRPCSVQLGCGTTG